MGSTLSAELARGNMPSRNEFCRRIDVDDVVGRSRESVTHRHSAAEYASMRLVQFSASARSAPALCLHSLISVLSTFSQMLHNDLQRR